MINMELTYWYTFECIPGSTIKRERKNRLYVDYFRSHVNNEKEKVCSRVSLVDFYDDTEYLNSHLTPDELSAINESKVQLPNSSFIVEDLLSQGYNLIPLDSPNYPDSIKKKLKLKSPLLLYVKGNMDLLKAPATAIVGCRKATQVSLDFASSMAKKAVSEAKVVVSGDAKGIDQMGQLTALENGGACIIVLPQGITTYNSGFRKYHKYYVDGRLLVISTFPRKATWNAGFAMERNRYVYGLASEIYVAESDSKGGTWKGVGDGLKVESMIYVRYPDKAENNANLKLIDMGANAIDMDGRPVEYIKTDDNQVEEPTLPFPD